MNGLAIFFAVIFFFTFILALYAFNPFIAGLALFISFGAMSRA